MSSNESISERIIFKTIEVRESGSEKYNSERGLGTTYQV